MTLEEKRELVEDFKKYEKYIYSILGTGTHYTNTKNPKVKIYNAQTALSMTDEDLIQQGRLYLWEALLNYGKFPERVKNKGRKVASKSTFVFTHLRNMFINLGIKTSCKKYQGVNVDLEACFNLGNCKIDSNIIQQEAQQILDDCKQWKRKDPVKYKEELKKRWIGE